MAGRNPFLRHQKNLAASARDHTTVRGHIDKFALSSKAVKRLTSRDGSQVPATHDQNAPQQHPCKKSPLLDRQSAEMRRERTQPLD
jgi:hypothetical protein